MSVGVNTASLAPLTGMAFYLNFVSEWGTAIVTLLAIITFVLTTVWRWIEHKARMRRLKERDDGFCN
ncbi:hypothetical protein IVIADoCa7_54 [Xanthomonas phage vB_Xar_IVIA-DoCa7]|uniref:Holin n=1 Tax=Xanthomonas phage vB_Xar_IVIA-DoCa7 TaxID=2975534 RepID=A0A9X9JN42_9CAUD|nr:hypothetical protein IVIADoCa7_54 [Xanthomonas phage vB_Xar_IVIA-DoCa7]